MYKFNKKYVVVFPGQGINLNISSNFFKNSIVKSTFEYASDYFNCNLIKIIQKGDLIFLKKTSFFSFLIVLVEISMWNVLIKNINTPYIVCGHSLGEYSALYASNILSFNNILKLLLYRSNLMKNNISKNIGNMFCIIGLNEDIVFYLCKKVSLNSIDFVNIACCNNLYQIVVSGHINAIFRLVFEINKLKFFYRMLKLYIYIPSHCYLMKKSSLLFGYHLLQQKFQNLKIEILFNYNCSFFHDKYINNFLLKQFFNSVRWFNIMDYCSINNINYIIECSPTNVLNKINKIIKKRFVCYRLDVGSNIILRDIN